MEPKFQPDVWQRRRLAQNHTGMFFLINLFICFTDLFAFARSDECCFQVHPFAKAYYYFGEPKWEQLQEIFGGEHNVQDTNTSEDVGDFSLVGSINSDVQFLGWKHDEEPEVIDLVTTEDEN